VFGQNGWRVKHGRLGDGAAVEIFGSLAEGESRLFGELIPIELEERYL